MRDEALTKAIAAAGSVKELAVRLGIRSQAISAWDRVPAERAREVERITGVPRHELRPDLWDAPDVDIPKFLTKLET